MATLRLLLAGLMAAAALAGCAQEQSPDLDSLYGPDAAPAGGDTLGVEVPGLGANGTVTVIAGAHLEGRLNDGAWGSNVSLDLAAVNVESPAMSGSAPMGGGGEATPLAAAENLTLEARIVERGELAGYTAQWYFFQGSANDTKAVAQPAGEVFERTVGPGSFSITVVLTHGADDVVVAVYAQPLTGTVKAHWTAHGQVQPVKPCDPAGLGACAPGGTARDGQVDIYSFAVGAGVTVTATTAFDGMFTPDMGTDVDLGIYDPTGEGLYCTGAGGAVTLPVGPDPAQADETIAGETTAAGTWSVQVGDITGCAGNAGYTYTNAGPVPYVLDIVAA